MLLHLRSDGDACKIKSLLEILDNALGLQKERDVVNRRHVVHADNLFRSNMTEHRDFCPRRRLERFWDY